MSPEQCSGDEVTGASDQYSLGVVAYEMLAGRPPFSGNSMMAIMYSHFHDEPPSLAALRPDVPAPLRDAIMRMLAKNPADRWPSVDAAAAAMGAKPLERDDPTRSQLITLVRSGTSHRVVHELRTPKSPIPLSQKQKDASQPLARARWRPVIAGAAAMVLLGAGYLIANLSGRTEPPAPSTPQQVVGSDAGAAIANPALPPVSDSVPQVVREPQASPKAADKQSTVRTTPPRTQIATAPNTTAAPQRTDTAPAVAAKPDVVLFDSSTPIRTPVQSVPLAPPNREAAVPPPPAVDEQTEVRTVIMAFARAIAARDLAAARRIYPTMPNEYREGFEALWRSGGVMSPRWTVSDILISGTTAMARVQGSNLVTLRGGTTSEPVALRARLERRGAEWRIVALIN
jgi:serine/threonine-protein kinase